MAASAKEYSAKVIEAIESGSVSTKKQLGKLKLTLGKQMGIHQLPSNPDILANSDSPSQKVRAALGIKHVRTLSGVAPVAIMTKPIRCPHGTCTYCPGGPGSPFGDVPQSYTGNEPATMRAINNSYDSYLQTMNRLYQYCVTGHDPTKVELIIMGGTFPSFPVSYQDEFISGAFAAANDFSEMFYKGGKADHNKLVEVFADGNYASKLLSLKKEINVEKEHSLNEKSNIKIVAMCIETKPDWAKQKEIDEMLRLGATRIELGAQSVYNEVLRATNRGHSIDDTIESTRLLKDSGFKVTYHMMPGQPLSSREKDIEMFRELFSNPDFRPDGLKIYPCMVMPGTALEKQWKAGKFAPLSTQEAAEIIAESKAFFPEWTRVYRVQRDIPTKFSLAGLDKNNLRQLIEQKAHEKGIHCRCIRCRGAGINSEKGIETDYSELKIVERKYSASEGEEVFISFEDMKNDLLLGFCRLRKPASPFRKEFTPNTTCIRELHVFGAALGLGEKSEGSFQHKGIGSQLMQRAEEIAAEQFGADKMLVISGVGARDYYSGKLGYARDGAYMGKKFH